MKKTSSVAETSPSTHVLGLDLDAEKAAYAICKGIEVQKTGILKLSELEAFLKARKKARTPIAAIACEYTGGIAVTWLNEAQRLGVDPYVLHVTERKAYQRLDGQITKTDDSDARGIARLLARWVNPELKNSLGWAHLHLFQPWEEVRHAWSLRGLVNDIDSVVKGVVADQNRAGAARRMGQESRAILWDAIVATREEQKEKFIEVALEFAREHYARELELLLTIPRIGERTALVLLGGLMPIERFIEYRSDNRKGEKVDHTPRNVSRYVGFIPNIESSGGKMIKNGHYYGGNKILKRALFIACLGIPSSKTGLFARYYTRRISEGTPGRKAVYLCAKKLLLVAVGVLRSGKPFLDPLAPLVVPKPERPEHLIGPSEAARIAGISRQSIHNQINACKLTRVEWEGDGKKYLLRDEVELIVKYERSKSTAADESTLEV
jgi:transposase